MPVDGLRRLDYGLRHGRVREYNLEWIGGIHLFAVLSCSELRRELSNYIDNDISPKLRKALDAHLSHCRSCSAIVDGTRNILVLIADDRTFPLPLGFSERLHARLRQELEPR